MTSSSYSCSNWGSQKSSDLSKLKELEMAESEVETKSNVFPVQNSGFTVTMCFNLPLTSMYHQIFIPISVQWTQPYKDH